MAIKKIQIIPPDNNYTDVLHPETSADQVQLSDTGNNFVATNVEGALTELFQNVSSGKNSIATAITGKGVTASGGDSFATLSTKIGQIVTDKTGDGTAVVSDIRSGKIAYSKGVRLVGTAVISSGNAVVGNVLAGTTFSNASSAGLTGTMVNRGAITSSLTTQGASYTIPAGYHSGSGKVTASFSNLSAGNIKKGVNIGGVVGTYETPRNAKVVTFNSNTSWTVPNDCFYLEVYMVGGGGGGTDGQAVVSASPYGGYGGSSGRIATGLFMVTPGQVININVGNGGVGQAYDTSYVYNGGESSVSGAISLSTADSDKYARDAFRSSGEAGRNGNIEPTGFPSNILQNVYGGASGAGTNYNTTFKGGTSGGGGHGGDSTTGGTSTTIRGKDATAIGSGGGGGGARRSSSGTIGKGGKGAKGAVYFIYK